MIIERLAELGETVNAASPLITIVDLRRLRVEAEIDVESHRNRSVLFQEGQTHKRRRPPTISELFSEKDRKPPFPGKREYPSSVRAAGGPAITMS